MPKRFEALDGCRGLAALMVALFHSPFYGVFYASPLVRHSYLWVDFFFVLSGFVISHATACGLNSGRTVAGFLIRRFGRVWPLHAAILGAFLVLELAKVAGGLGGIAPKHMPFAGAHSFGSLLANLVLIQSLGLYDSTTWNGPSWSICVEFWTYIVFAVVLWMQPRRTIAAAAVICLASAAVIAWVAAYREFSDITYDLGLARCLFGFFLGHLAYRLVQDRPLPQPGKAGAAAEAIAVIAVVGFVWRAGVVFPPAVGALVFAAAVYVFAAEAGPVSRALRSAIVTRLGAWSYGIYMTHLLVIILMLQAAHVVEKCAGIALLRPAIPTDPNIVVIGLPGSAWATDIATLAYLLITLALSALLCRWIETPGRTAFARYARRWTERPVGIGAARAGAASTQLSS